MQTKRMIRIFNDRYPLVGPVVWMFSIQYFIIQLISALAWNSPFSLLQNTISDLGNTVCGTYSGRFVCSPLHATMNLSFITFGITMALGSLLIYQEFRKNVGSLVGFSAMAVAGLGTIMVGLFPENTIGALHVLGASGPFLIGNFGMVILGIYLPLPKSLRIYTLVLGGIALIALGFFYSKHYVGLGIGGMERIVAYPQTLWLISFGIYMSRSHYKSLKAGRIKGYHSKHARRSNG